MRGIEEKLGLPTSVEKAKDIIKTVEQSLATIDQMTDIDPEFDEDFETVRQNVRELAIEVKETVARISLVAYESEKADHYGAMASMATVLLNCNKQMLQIYEAKKKYKAKKEKMIGPAPSQGGAPININNAVFTGTTKDLQEFIQKMKEKKDSEEAEENDTSYVDTSYREGDES